MSKLLLGCAALLLLGTSGRADSLPVTAEFQYIERVTGNPLLLIFPNAWDIYHVVATNPNDEPVFGFDLSLDAAPDTMFSQIGGNNWKVGAEQPTVFGFLAADTFFVLPDGASPPDICVGNCGVDTEDQLAGRYEYPDGPPLVPANGSSTIIAIAFLEGQEIVLPTLTGSAFIGQDVVPVVVVPEPGAAAMLGGLLALAALRRRAR